MNTDYEATMKQYEQTIKTLKAVIKNSENELIVQTTKREQYAAQLAELTEQCFSEFGVGPDELEQMIDENLKKLQTLHDAIQKVPHDVKAVTEQDVESLIPTGLFEGVFEDDGELL